MKVECPLKPDLLCPLGRVAYESRCVTCMGKEIYGGEIDFTIVESRSSVLTALCVRARVCACVHLSGVSPRRGTQIGESKGLLDEDMELNGAPKESSCSSSKSELQTLQGAPSSAL